MMTKAELQEIIEDQEKRLDRLYENCCSPLSSKYLNLLNKHIESKTRLLNYDKYKEAHNEI